jgi:hypothetical protein
MAHGGNFVLSKGWKVLTTYNGSNANGVQSYRAVKIGAADTIDLVAASTDRTLGVVQEDIDRTKVATGKAVANVAHLGITKMRVGATPGALAQGVRVAADADGEAILATTATHVPIGVQTSFGTPNAGDLIDVLLTPGLPVI